jgi:uncharacterized protein (DUF1501 family)
MNTPLRKVLDRSKPNRRDFMVQSTCAGLGITSAVNTLSQLSLIGVASKANAAGGAGDFKALVCLFLNGGNDSNNLLIPTGSTPARTDYITGRGTPTYAGGTGGIGVPLSALTATGITADNAGAFEPSAGYTNNNFALHPACAPMKTLFDAQELAFVCNVGTLSQPGITRANFNSVPVASKPPQLFSHSDQQTQWQSSIPDRPFSSGWGGRLSDYLMGSAYNATSAGLAIGVSLSGVNSFQVGMNEQPYVVGTAGATPFTGFVGGAPSSNYGAGLTNANLKPFITGAAGYDPLASTNYQATASGYRLRAIEQLMAMSHANLLDAEHQAVSKSARLTEGLISDALVYTDGTTGPSLDPYFTAAFGGSATAAGTDFAMQLKMVARLIIGNKALLVDGKAGNDRLVFFSQQGGFDTHTSQIATNNTNTAVNTAAGQHALLDVLSRSIKGFYDAILGHPRGGTTLWNSVLGFSASDFTRTLTPNKTDASGGSDHGWGGHAFVLGGAVKGKKIYGTFPTLQVNAGVDCTGNRGRWIPSTSVDQYAAKIAQWMGVPAGTQLDAIFPNLTRFGSGTNLDFIDYAV